MKKIANVYSKYGTKFASIYKDTKNGWFYFYWCGCTSNFCCSDLDIMENHIKEKEPLLSDGYIKYLKSFNHK